MGKILVHTPWNGTHEFEADTYAVEEGYLDIEKTGVGVIATFPADSWQWVEARDREPEHPRRERVSSEESVVPIRARTRSV